jgi:pathogenesis-related protein 1
MAPASTLSLLLLFTLVLPYLSTLAVADDTSQVYLDAHNAARADVGVAPLVWSTTLENYALTYSQSQIYQCVPLTHSDGPYGENLFWGSGANWTPQDAVASWVSENQYYDEPTNTCSAPEGESCLHYTQVVWSSTTDLGCASVSCQDGSTFLICSYDPPGNWNGERPYWPSASTYHYRQLSG